MTTEFEINSLYRLGDSLGMGQVFRAFDRLTA